MPAKPETALVKSILQYLAYHPRVARAWRQNTGQFKLEGRYIRMGEAGISDVLGFMKDGRFLAIEAKVGKNKPTPLQQAFLADVRGSGGVGILAYSLDDVTKGLEADHA